MAEKSNQKTQGQSEATSSTSKKGKPLWEEFQEIPYSHDKVGQGFVMSTRNLSEETKRLLREQNSKNRKKK